MTPIRRPRAIACIALLVLMGFSLGFSEFTVIGVEPELAEAFDVPLARVGELISFFSVAYAVLTPLLAVSTGRFRRFTLLTVYVALFCVSNIMMTFAPTFEVDGASFTDIEVEVEVVDEDSDDEDVDDEDEAGDAEDEKA